MKIHVFLILLAFIYRADSEASVYATLDEARRGISLGNSGVDAYKFTEAVGQLRILRSNPDKDGHVKFGCNATLIRPDMILTVAHAFDKEYRAAAVIFYPDAEIVSDATHKAKSLGIKPEDVYLEDESGLKVSDVTSSLDLDTIKRHKSYDIAIVRLKTPLTRISPLPLCFDTILEDKSLGYLVSTNKIYVSGDTSPISVSKRHVSMIDFYEGSLLKEDGRNCNFLIKEWEVDGDISDPHNRSCKFKSTDPSLLAYNYGGDSGAPLITTKGIVIGVLKGSYNYSNTDCNTVITPLCYVKEWILSFIR